MVTHSSVLAWRIPGMEEPGGLPSMGSHRARHDRSDLAAAAACQKDKPKTSDLNMYFRTIDKIKYSLKNKAFFKFIN